MGGNGLTPMPPPSFLGRGLERLLSYGVTAVVLPFCLGGAITRVVFDTSYAHVSSATTRTAALCGGTGLRMLTSCAKASCWTLELQAASHKVLQVDQVVQAATGVDQAAAGVDPAATSVDQAATGVDPATTSVDQAATGMGQAATGVDQAVLQAGASEHGNLLTPQQATTKDMLQAVIRAADEAVQADVPEHGDGGLQAARKGVLQAADQGVQTDAAPEHALSAPLAPLLMLPCTPPGSPRRAPNGNAADNLTAAAATAARQPDAHAPRPYPMSPLSAATSPPASAASPTAHIHGLKAAQAPRRGSQPGAGSPTMSWDTWHALLRSSSLTAQASGGARRTSGGSSVNSFGSSSCGGNGGGGNGKVVSPASPGQALSGGGAQQGPRPASGSRLGTPANRRHSVHCESPTGGSAPGRANAHVVTDSSRRLSGRLSFDQAAGPATQRQMHPAAVNTGGRPQWGAPTTVRHRAATHTPHPPPQNQQLQ
ncbi:hypothetical protein FOA52_010101 [Chlamydomonas sp. UWO 241]|nr:hypothetical protein FOA52_010101 [Chlamydomonas sp. UWO 241]